MYVYIFLSVGDSQYAVVGSRWLSAIDRAYSGWVSRGPPCLDDQKRADHVESADRVAGEERLHIRWSRSGHGFRLHTTRLRVAALVGRVALVGSPSGILRRGLQQRELVLPGGDVLPLLQHRCLQYDPITNYGYCHYYGEWFIMSVSYIQRVQSKPPPPWMLLCRSITCSPANHSVLKAIRMFCFPTEMEWGTTSSGKGSISSSFVVTLCVYVLLMRYLGGQVCAPG